MGFVTLPAGQDPDDLLRAKGRGAVDSLLATPEALVDRLWRHESEAEPLTTPEQRAGLRQRLMDHVGTIGDPHVRDQYRSELLERFNALTRPQKAPWSRGGAPAGKWKKDNSPRGGRFVLHQPASDRTKAVAHTGLDSQWTLGVLQGLLRFPQLIAEHAQAIAKLPIAEKPALALRDAMLHAAMIHGELDQERLNTILAEMDAGSQHGDLRLQQGLAFSFTRRDADAERACRDLVLVIETLAARPGLEAALAAATARLKDDGDEAAFQEQQRLRTARDEIDRQLATLIEGDAG